MLAPGGSAILVDGAAPELRAADTHLQAVELLRDPSHVRDYSRREWLAMLTEAASWCRASRRIACGWNSRRGLRA